MRNLRNRKIIALSLVVFLLAGCAGFAVSASGEGETYLIRVACDNESPRYENIERAAARLNEQLAADGIKDKITTEYVRVSKTEEIVTNFALWDKTGNLPEMAVINVPMMVKFAEAGFIVPVDDLAKGEAYSQLFEGLQDITLYKGHYYAVVQDMESRPVWFFKNHLKSLGWSEEDIAAFPDKIAHGEFTQKDLQNLAKEAVDKKICEMGIVHRPKNGAEFKLLYMINGGKAMMDDKEKVIINPQAMTNFLTYLRENVEMGLCPADITTFGWDPIEGDIQPNGKTLCWYGGVWNKYDMMVAGGVTPEYVDENFIMTLPPPVNKGERPMTLSNPMLYCLTKEADANPKLRAYIERVLEIVLDPDIQLNTTVATSHLAITPAAAEHPDYKAESFLSGVTYTVEYTQVNPGDQRLEFLFADDTFFAAIQAAEMTDESIEAIVNRYVEDVKYRLGENNYVIAPAAN